tara:strand:+ start:293 stop:1120 length:828 start_codon:yes stop_codon:yes gene_type:complete
MKKIREFIKSILGNKLYNFLYSIYLAIINPKKELPNLILNRKYNIKDKDGSGLFSVRLLGGSTFSRAKSFFKSEPETINWIKSFKKNSVFFDIGANIGLYSLYSAKLNHSVVSFEPESLNFAALNLNISDNNFQKNITCYPIALDDNFLISNLNIHKFRFGSSGHSFNRPANSSDQKLEYMKSQGSISITLDQFSETQNIFPDYLKIDVDGNELNVINGMKNLLKSKKIKSILIEINKNYQEHQKVIKIIESHNYRLDYYADSRHGANNHIFNLL